MGRQAQSVRFQYPAVLRYVRRRANSAADAEDATQEAFANAAEALARSTGAAPPMLGWLYTVARRRLIDEARRRNKDVVPLELVRESGREDEYGGLVARALDAALASMGEPNRHVVILRLLRGRSFAEISAELGVTEEACRMRFMRGLELLRAVFENEGLRP